MLNETHRARWLSEEQEEEEHRISMIVLCTVITAQCVAVAMLLISDASAAIMGANVYDDTRLTAFVLVGSIIGALLSIAIFAPTNDSDVNKLRRLCLKFGSSMASGIAFTPAVMRYCGFELTADSLIAGGAITALFAVSVIHAMAPKVERWFANRIKDTE